MFPRPTERRSLLRVKKVLFRFLSQTGQTFESTAQEATIRSAKFPLADLDRISQFGSGIALFANIETPFEGMTVPREFILKEKGTFIVTFKTRQLAIGQKLPDGKYAEYEIVKFLGGGQSGETYRAAVTKVKDPDKGLTTGQLVIIKLPLFVPYLSTAEFDKLAATIGNLFSTEETSLQRLADLDCVATFLDTGIHFFPRKEVASTKFMVQKLVGGQSLDEYLIEQCSASGNAGFNGLSSDEFYRFGRLLADAVRKVHSKLVIHGDIWPENIRVANGKPVLIDFGEAVLREAVGNIVRVAGRNSRYIAPEKTRSVGADVYSLGGVLFYLATGEDPPDSIGDIEALKEMIVQKIRLRNQRLYRENRGCADIITRCLRMSDRRTAHAQGVIEDLEIFFAKPVHEPVQVTDAIEEVAQESKRLDEKGHKLFRWMAKLRVNAIRHTVSEMASGVYDLVGDHEVVTAGMTQYLGLLGEGDEYLTISIPKLWYPDNLGVFGRFMSMNTIAAQRGATIKRLFIISRTDYKAKHFQPFMNAQRQVLQDIEELGLDKFYQVKILEVSKERAEEMLHQGDHFGLLVKQDDEIAVFPEYRRDGFLAAVKFRAGENLVGSLRQTFERYWGDPEAVPLTAI